MIRWTRQQTTRRARDLTHSPLAAPTSRAARAPGERRAPGSDARRVGHRIVCAVALLASIVGCDEVVDVENLAPQVEAVGWCTVDARTFLVLRLIDREQDSIDLTLRAASCGGCELETGGAGDGLRGLQSTSGEPGALHRIEWRNADGPAGELDFEVEATDAAGRRPAEQLVFPPLAACPG